MKKIQASIQKNLVSDFEIEDVNLKKELEKILNHSIGKPASPLEMKKIKARLNDLFNKFELNDLQWYLIMIDQRINIAPVRYIDQLVLDGIKSSLNESNQK